MCYGVHTNRFLFQFMRKKYFNLLSILLNKIKDKAKIKIFSKKLTNLDFFDIENEYTYKMVSYNHLKRKKNKFMDRFENGDHCFLILDGTKIAHTSWLTFRDIFITENNKLFKIKPNEACIYDVSTEVEYRSLGLYTNMLNRIIIYCKFSGVKKCYIYSEANNVPSIKGIIKAGFENDVETYKNRLFDR